MRFPAHWSFRYACDKVRVLAYEWTHPAAPWFARDAKRQIEKRLRPNHIGFEWGCGRSTVWLAKRVRELVSVEHDPAWAERVRGKLAANGLNNVTLVVEDGATETYVSPIERFEDEGLDFVLVDGLSGLRDACAVAALPKLRPGGFIVIDDVHRYLPCESRSPLALPRDAEPASPLWGRFAEQTALWQHTWTSSGVQDTAIWTRPDRSAEQAVRVR